MAFYRANIHVPSFASNVSFKVSIDALKLHLSRRLSSAGKKPMVRHPENSTLLEYIRLRKEEARRSIIIQIDSKNTYHELIPYCKQFGDVANVFCYTTHKNYVFTLVEYRSLNSAQTVLNYARNSMRETSFIGGTNALWFRKSKKNHKREDNLFMSYSDNTSDLRLNETYTRQKIAQCLTISEQMKLLYIDYRVQDLEVRLKFQTITNLEQCFSGLFPYAEIHPFGSFINGFGKRLSDLDLVMYTNSVEKVTLPCQFSYHMKHPNLDEKKRTLAFMELVANAMSCAIPGIVYVRKIFRARVPIIKFSNIFTTTECDLSVNNLIATYMTELLFLYGELDNRVRPLVFTVRKWASENNLTSVHVGKTITNFALTLLVIFYLQKIKLLPVINEMDSFSVGVMNQYKNSLNKIYTNQLKFTWTMSQKNPIILSELLANFFEFYCEFNFNANEICLRSGSVHEKQNTWPMHIRNPFEENLNVSQNVSFDEVERIKAAMAVAVDNLNCTSQSKSINWGILSLFGANEPLSVNIDVSRVFHAEEKGNEITEKIVESGQSIETNDKISTTTPMT